MINCFQYCIFFAFKFNLRHYTTGTYLDMSFVLAQEMFDKVGRCRLTPG